VIDNIENLTDKILFPELSFSCQNVLSLNVSTRNSKTDLKILAVTKKNCDVILLSDTRLNTDKQTAALHDLTKKFLHKGYNFIHNSKSASRGVAILIKKSLTWSIHRKICDIGDNFLVLDITISGKKFTLAAIYGPNNDDMLFYDNLLEAVRSVGNTSIVAGGDWNTTWDSSPVHNNIDVINMNNIPSKRRSEKINAIARNLSLTDPYRYLFPTRKEFTFVPNIAGNRNRSRLDFWIFGKHRA
jgi:exonuclease III